jgi:hypothetical protein
MSSLQCLQAAKIRRARFLAMCWKCAKWPSNPRYRHLVDDLADEMERMRERLKTSNYRMRAAAEIIGYTPLFTEDPFGNRIEIMQHHPA